MTQSFEEKLVRHWNAGCSLKTIVNFLGRSKKDTQRIIKFFRGAARKYGYSQHISTTNYGRRSPTREEIIKEYSSLIGNKAFPTYADWCGTSVNAQLKKHGYEILTN